MEIMMATIVTKTARAVRKTPPSLVPNGPLLDPLDGNPGRGVRAKEARQDRKTELKKRYLDPTICEGEYAAAEQEFM
jgi:hypothetical protein